MTKKFTPEQEHVARRSELYDYLLTYHSNAIKRTGNTIYLLRQKSVKVKKGRYGYVDYKTGENGNSIDYLMKYFGYRFDDAVDALLHKQP